MSSHTLLFPELSAANTPVKKFVAGITCNASLTMSPASAGMFSIPAVAKRSTLDTAMSSKMGSSSVLECSVFGDAGVSNSCFRA